MQCHGCAPFERSPSAAVVLSGIHEQHAFIVRQPQAAAPQVVKAPSDLASWCVCSIKSTRGCSLTHCREQHISPPSAVVWSRWASSGAAPYHTQQATATSAQTAPAGHDSSPSWGEREGGKSRIQQGQQWIKALTEVKERQVFYKYSALKWGLCPSDETGKSSIKCPC